MKYKNIVKIIHFIFNKIKEPGVNHTVSQKYVSMM